MLALQRRLRLRQTFFRRTASQLFANKKKKRDWMGPMAPTFRLGYIHASMAATLAF